MKTKTNNYFHKSACKNFLAIILLINLVAGIDLNTFATDTSSLHHLRNSGKIIRDTVKMTVGVPLKPEDISPLLIGEAIPVLNLPSASGKSFDLNKSVAEKPTILVFYRGGWCPYCSKQLSGLQEIEKDLAGMGYQVIAISTDSPENLSKSMDKQKLSYTLLSDADLSASKKFGIAFKSPKGYDKFLPETSGGKNVDKLLPVPSVFILSKKGNILFEYINPNITQRLSASLLKAAAMSLREEI
ncbi:MAG: AhpC/TSA family protein [Pedobacter sp.]|nr:AhpC/TSA family protein [Pedobacter sp.]